MAEDGESPNRKVLHQQYQETFQRVPETQVEQRFPNHSSGIIFVPPGSKGPRILYLKRHGDSFGFTLRHFILYPPDSVSAGGGHAAVGALLIPMDTIFVKNVTPHSSAAEAGLHCGDRIVGINGTQVTNKSYAEVVHLIKHSPPYLQLLVVPKEEDVIQKFFPETAHNPVSNQAQNEAIYSERALAHWFANQYPKPQQRFDVDQISWDFNQDPRYSSLPYGRLAPNNAYKQQQKSADNIFSNAPLRYRPQALYTEPITDESYHRPRAQPQVPLYKKMGRRASEGSTIPDTDLDYHRFTEYSSLNSGSSDMVVSSSKMKGASKVAYPNSTSHTSHGNEAMQTFTYPNTAGCRLSMDAGRRESSSSISSSLADGSKDSLSYYDSTSTLTGQEMDDSVIMNRFRKSLQKKEEFLRRPSQPFEPAAIQREFYSRPKKLDKPSWPPNEPIKESSRHDSPTRTAKPLHQNFQRVKTDIDYERDMVSDPQGRDLRAMLMAGGVVGIPQEKGGVQSPKQALYYPSTMMQEASPAPSHFANSSHMNGSALLDASNEDKRAYLHNLQVVYKRARQFETGRPLPEDDPMLNDRTSFYKSELARLTSKRAVPNVTNLAHEFESRSYEPKRDTSGSSANTNSGMRRHHRDSRSVDSSDMLQYVDNEPSRMRTRSNSTGSWVLVPQEVQNQKTPPRKDTRVIVEKKRIEERPQNEAMDDQMPRNVPASSLRLPDSPPLIPESVESMHTTPPVTITPAISLTRSPPVRPNQLDLGSPTRSRRLMPYSNDSSPRRSVSPANLEDHNKPVVMRRAKNTNLADEDRIMRRESYLKATGSGRMPVDEFSDGEVSPQATRSSHRKWRPPLFPGDIQQLRKLFEDAASSLGGSASGESSSSVSLDRERASLPSSPLEKDKQNIIKEGLLHCKIAEIDGKRAGDRSWKQMWVVLRGPKLFIYKDRSHQSPSDTAEQSLASGVDMRASCVRVAGDYTKRKHVFRVSSINPCRSELLLQAESTTDLADWVKELQEQVAVNTDLEANLDPNGTTKQQAVPQQVPASTTIQVQGSSRLSPQPNKQKLTTLRNRSPTGQSPVSKTRKPSQISDGLTSPKSKTWRGRVAKQFRKIQGASSPSSPTGPDVSTFGVALEHCYPSINCQFVPRIVEVCTEIVESKGLDVVGIYRVPGNNAAITALTNSINQCYDGVPLSDVQWNDIHVVTSLLKSFFRKLPDALLTSGQYSHFIEVDKIEAPYIRMEEMRSLVKNLPPHHYHTLKHLMLHLKKVSDHWEVNKMEGKNLAIMFGPTLIRAVQEDMVTMVNDMSHNYKIVESLICHADWFFCEDDSVTLKLPAPISAPTEIINNELEAPSNRALLLDNISKVEGFKPDHKEKKEILSSILLAAQRKMRKGGKSSSTSQESKDDSSNDMRDYSYQPMSPTDLKQESPEVKHSIIPTTVADMENSVKQNEKSSCYSYNDKDIRRRVENFIQETNANLQRNRRTADFGSLEQQGLPGALGSVSQQNVLASLPKTNFDDPRILSKTNSASNVFYRTANSDNVDKNSGFIVQYDKRSDLINNKNSNFNSAQINRNGQYQSVDLNQNKQANSGSQSVYNNRYMNKKSGTTNLKPFVPERSLRRGSSVENINTGMIDIGNNGMMKKIKYGNEGDHNPRTGSLDSLHKIQDEDGTDLHSSIMKIFDEKKRTLNPLLGEDIPFADESPERPAIDVVAYQNKENIPHSPKLYRNPSLHKSLISSSKLSTRDNINETKPKEIKTTNSDEEKDRDSTESVPDNERHISNNDKLTLNSNNINNNNNKCNTNVNFSIGPSTIKLKRSESLNKPERTVSPSNNKLKRSESLNKTSDRLKRSDSLTKNEKTESNINRKREISSGARRTNKEFMKLKRKNGMPERSIKRRHTVGGTKDLDKVHWLDNRCEEENLDAKENNKEKSSLRTSSPDLSSARRERLFFEVNLIGPQNMVVALRQHLIGARPQSLPEPRIFTVPLESHV